MRRRRMPVSPPASEEEDPTVTLLKPTDTLDIGALLTDGTQLIGGEFVGARGGETIAVENPATGEVLAHVPRSRSDDVADAVTAASEAFPAWRDMSPGRRGQLLLDWAALCRSHAEEIDLLSSSTRRFATRWLPGSPTRSGRCGWVRGTRRSTWAR
jgi:Aldehyde dehydrogenase family